MVNKIDIRTFNIEELSGLVSLYPWFAHAHMEMCSRLAAADALSEAQIAQAALHVCSRKLLYRRVKSRSNQVIPVSIPLPRATYQQRFRATGGDYFTQEEYNSVKKLDGSIFRQPAEGGEYTAPVTSKGQDEAGLFTETLARIYVEQGYMDEAVDIYSKLSLRYPEKSVYFAALIDEINKNR